MTCHSLNRRNYRKPFDCRVLLTLAYRSSRNTPLGATVDITCISICTSRIINLNIFYHYLTELSHINNRLSDERVKKHDFIIFIRRNLFFDDSTDKRASSCTVSKLRPTNIVHDITAATLSHSHAVVQT